MFDGLAALGLFGVAVPEECGGAGGGIEDLAAMVDEAARALVPGPVAVHGVSHARSVRSDAARGTRIRAAHRRVALHSDVEFDETVAQEDQLARLIITAQGGSLLDQRIAQLAVGGQNPGAQSSVRKLIGVRYRPRHAVLHRQRDSALPGRGCLARDLKVAAICHGVLLATRSVDPATGHSVLYGGRTTALTYSEEPGHPSGYMSVQS